MTKPEGYRQHCRTVDKATERRAAFVLQCCADLRIPALGSVDDRQLGFPGLNASVLLFEPENLRAGRQGPMLQRAWGSVHPGKVRDVATRRIQAHHPWLERVTFQAQRTVKRKESIAARSETIKAALDLDPAKPSEPGLFFLARHRFHAAQVRNSRRKLHRALRKLRAELRRYGASSAGSGPPSGQKPARVDSASVMTQLRTAPPSMPRNAPAVVGHAATQA